MVAVVERAYFSLLSSLSDLCHREISMATSAIDLMFSDTAKDAVFVCISRQDLVKLLSCTETVCSEHVLSLSLMSAASSQGVSGSPLRRSACDKMCCA